MSQLIDSGTSPEERTTSELVNLLEETKKYLDNIDEFVEEVSTQLTSYEIKTVQMLKKINDKNKTVDSLIDRSMGLIDEYEQGLYLYEKSFVNIRSNFDELEMFSAWEQKQKSQLELFKELSNLKTLLDVDSDSISRFFDLDATSLPAGMREFCQNLVEVFKRNLPPGASLLSGVKTQLAHVDSATIEFCDCFTAFLGNLLNKLVGEAPVFSEPSSHPTIHDRLNVYAPIVECVKTLNSVKFSEINTTYCKILGEFYKKEWKSYTDRLVKELPTFDCAKNKKTRHSLLHRDTDDVVSRCHHVEQVCWGFETSCFMGSLHVFAAFQKRSASLGRYFSHLKQTHITLINLNMLGT